MAQRPQHNVLLDSFSSLPPAGGGIFVAFSGGLDSTVLLHALVAAGFPHITAVHVHHGLQHSADDWAAHCVQFCSTLQVECRVRYATIDPADPAGPEAAARAARYALLRTELSPGATLATGHHRDDQAETVLLQLLRGCGVHGLAAMRASSPFPPGLLWRPFLNIERASLRRYAEAHALPWLDDPHNHDARYTRSWLRATLLPALRSRWPHADQSLANAAARADEASTLLDELADDDLKNICRDNALQISELSMLSAARRRNLLRRWLVKAGFMPPAAGTFARIEQELMGAKTDANPLLALPGLELRRYRNCLYAMPPLAMAPSADTWSGGRQFGWGGGALIATAPPPRPLRVRSILPGECLRPAGGGHHRTAKNLFQERGVPPWLRTRIPVIELEGRIACIAGVAATDEWCAFTADCGWNPAWQHEYCGLESPLAL